MEEDDGEEEAVPVLLSMLDGLVAMERSLSEDVIVAFVVLLLVVSTCANPFTRGMLWFVKKVFIKRPELIEKHSPFLIANYSLYRFAKKVFINRRLKG